jgi:uncharacterized protein YcbK (DUF882 family)
MLFLRMIETDIDNAPLLFSRRGFVTAAAGAAATLVLPEPVFAAAKKETRKLSFDHTHTGESMDVTYWADGNYVKDGLKKLNYLLRDFRNDKQKTIDPRLLDRLVMLQRSLGSNGRFEIISAYRSPQTNAMLRRHSYGVAKNSYHLQAKAIDIRLTDVDLYALRTAAVNMGGGGVGIYTGADFLHIDTGPQRTWG